MEVQLVKIGVDGNACVTLNLLPIPCGRIEAPLACRFDRGPIELAEARRLLDLDVLRRTVAPDQNHQRNRALVTLANGLRRILGRITAVIAEIRAGLNLRRRSRR